MAHGAHSAAKLADDRLPFDVADAVLQMTNRHAQGGVVDAQAAMLAIRDSKGPDYTDCLNFYHQLQELYEFARSHVEPDEAKRICFRAGQHFAERILAENTGPLERAALAAHESLQATVVEVVRSYVTHFTGANYSINCVRQTDEIEIHVAWRDASRMSAYLAEHDCEVHRSQQNGLDFLAGAVELFVARLTSDYRSERFRIEVKGKTAVIHAPVGHGDSVNCDTVIRIFAERIRKLESRQREPTAAETPTEIFSASTAMHSTWSRLRRAARSDELILLRGESGTGKTLLARQVHKLSRRRNGPMVEVALTSDLGSDNLVQSDLFGHERGAFTGASAPKHGLFWLANGGTIFLDEIGDASPEVQARLLRVLETGKFRRLGGVRDLQVDIRVLAATNRDLEAMVTEKRFREDLYYRLNVIQVDVPSLRERREEIAELAQYLLERALDEHRSPRRTLPSELAQRLSWYDWPGNVRELNHAIRHAIAMAEGTVLEVADLPETVRAALTEAPGSARDASHQGLATTPRAPPAGSPRHDGAGRDRENPNGRDIVDLTALRRAIRATNPVTLAEADTPADHPAHIDHARRLWLATLIDECHGNLALIASFWNRGSEKTLRNLVRRLDLTERLAHARAQHRSRE